MTARPRPSRWTISPDSWTPLGWSSDHGPALARLDRWSIAQVADLAIVVVLAERQAAATVEAAQPWWRLVQLVACTGLLCVRAGRSVLVATWASGGGGGLDNRHLVAAAVGLAYLAGVAGLLVPEARAAHFRSAALIVALVTLGHLELARVWSGIDRWAPREPAPGMAGVVAVALGLAGLTVLAWLALGRSGWTASAEGVGQFGWALRCGLGVLVAACPWAIVWARPSAAGVGLGSVAQSGVEFRGAAAFRAAGRVTAVLFNKTGTLTTGSPEVKAVFDEPLGPITPGEREVLEWAASAERPSEHPLGRAILAQARGQGVSSSDPEQFEDQPGLGVATTVRGRTVLVGSAELMTRHGVDVSPVEARHAQMLADGQTVALLAIDGVCAGLIGVADTPQPGASLAVTRLAEQGLDVAMVTGDQPAAAGALAAAVGIKDVHAQLSPEGKVDEVRRRQGLGQRVAFVGESLSDQPALAAADVGMTFAAYSDTTAESAAILMAEHDLPRVAEVIRLSRRTLGVARQNFILAVVYNIVAIPLAAVGALPPGWAAGGMMLASIAVLANSKRLREGYSAESAEQAAGRTSGEGA
jgi:P-type E1-E2 ATPase